MSDRTPTLADLPSPPRGRTGWPWTEAPAPRNGRALEGHRPSLSIVTPSYNQAEFLEETIRSVLLQGLPGLEYVIVDGGSDDGSQEIIERYSPWLSDWVSEPDEGHYDALNKGFSRTSGDWMAWINSDDKYAPGAFWTIAEIAAALPRVRWLTSVRPILWARDGGEMWCRSLPGFCRRAFLQGEYVVGVAPFHTGWIQQESTFWHRELWQEAGSTLDSSLRLAADFELWSRFYGRDELYGVDARLGGFRRYGNQRSSLQYSSYVDEAREALRRSGGEPAGAAWAATRRLVTRLPAGWRRRLRAVGLCYSGSVIKRRRGGGWQIVEAAV